VQDIAEGKSEIQKALGGEEHQTRTRGDREQPESRPAGEGVYALVGHDDHTHLSYILELPQRRDQVQRELNIRPEADYVVALKNPQQPSPAEAGLDEKRQAWFPKRLQQAFDSRRFIGLQSTEFLEYAGAELLLVSAGEDLSQELELELDPDREQQHTADVFNDLRFQRDQHKVKPLVEGKWQ
jgi:hypothetical protein